MGQIGQSFQQYLTSYFDVEALRIQLVELKNGEVRLEIIGVLAGLDLDVFLQSREILRIVSVKSSTLLNSYTPTSRMDSNLKGVTNIEDALVRSTSDTGQLTFRYPSAYQLCSVS